MSQGEFLYGSYETDEGNFMPIRYMAATAALSIGGTANAVAATAASDDFGSVRVGGGKRQLGVKARSVRVKFTAAPPTGYKEGSSLTLPVFQKSVHDGYSKGNTGTYRGVAIVVTGVPAAESKA